MKRGFRLRKSTDFERVRREGQSYAHPLMVLLISPNQLNQSRFGITAGRSVGGAVQRNRAKRRIRSALNPLISQIPPGWDVIVIARRPINETSFDKLVSVLHSLLRRAQMLR